MEQNIAGHLETAMQKLNDRKHAMKLMWGCMVLAVVALVLGFTGVGVGAVFIVPCMLMMGAMLWMVMGPAVIPAAAGRELAARHRQARQER